MILSLWVIRKIVCFLHTSNSLSSKLLLNFQMAFFVCVIFFFNFLTLQYCIGFAIYQHESATGIHVFAILNPPSSFPVPSLWVVPVHQPQASSIVHRTWTGMFQCHSPKSSHPLPLPQSPQDCSIHQCLFCCLVYRVKCYHLSKFHIYDLVYCIGVFLSGLLHSV